MRLFDQGGFTRSARFATRCAGEHRQHSDSFLEFMDEMTELGSDKRVLVDDFYRAYVDYCGRSGRHPKAKAEIGKQVLRLTGVTKERQASGARKYEYHGIGIRFGAVSAVHRGQHLPAAAVSHLPSDN